MSIAHMLEDFSQSFSAHTGGGHRDTNSDAELLDSFEQGYKAGWEDAIRAKSEERASVSADLARNIRDLSFTYHEAREAILTEIAPVVEQAITTVLPEISRQSIGMQVMEELSAIIQENADTQVLLTTSPGNYEAVSEILPKDVNFPVDVVRDAGLGDGQIRFQFGNRERQIDLNEVLNTVSRAFEGFTYETRKEA